MKIFGRKILKYSEVLDADFDELVFVTDDHHEIVVSLYGAKVDGKIEIRTNTGILSLWPRAANLIQVKAHR